MISRGHIVSLRKNVVIRPYLAYHREGVIRRHFCRQMAQTSDASGFWRPNFAENGVWDHLTRMAETRANTEVRICNLSSNKPSRSC